MKIKLGISPCPNDTFMFYHLINSNQFNLDLTIVDVEELNHKVLNHGLDISKVSIYTAMRVGEHYNLLDSGAALGRNCGPLLVTKAGSNEKRLEDSKIGIPGLYTTANLLFSLFANNGGKKMFMPFNRIMPAVTEGLVDFGVIIHEGRFTYKNHGLIKVVDLGEWWENISKLPIPLGGIVARRKLPEGLVREFSRTLRESIAKALGEKDKRNSPLYTYVRKYAQEMEMDVIKRHINLYVNDYSLSLGGEGRRAIDKLFKMAKELD